MRRNVWLVGLIMLGCIPLVLAGYPAVQRLVTPEAPTRLEVPVASVLSQNPPAAEVQKQKGESEAVDPFGRLMENVPSQDSGLHEPLQAPLGCVCPDLCGWIRVNPGRLFARRTSPGSRQR